MSNTLQEKGISDFLKAHGVHHPKTIRKLIPIVKSVVRGNVFRGGTIVGITIGGGLIISRFFFGSGQTDRSDSGGVAAPRSDLHDNDNTRLAEIDKRVKEEFGDKYILAEFLLVNSIARYDGERKGDIVVYSRLQECAAEMQPAQTEKEKALASSADTMCLSQRTVLKCSLEQVKVRRVLNDILSRITVENDTISWNEGEFSEH